MIPVQVINRMPRKRFVMRRSTVAVIALVMYGFACFAAGAAIF